mmetsp:Transcript_8515/g.9900  ORF Transcript_8515/g.9900 Transcript_8515/m.9900 type:complete len:316 (-) Transcript_8515:353-1300(-)|eukprot:CAMPEP_0197843434 /NCGR_PEP_ID=MMETSP1438-20131217/317_1 /TAXON_ID=1461541 /ORGANISM="Pterosperma sp., Strain CCMP1384" /LENGTH=315 /DNA_ID=CAMNT_0043453585 /DNA_START=1700 /DNA_END=2647 /DNA_ORIENTATION=-
MSLGILIDLTIPKKHIRPLFDLMGIRFGISLMLGGLLLAFGSPWYPAELMLPSLIALCAPVPLLCVKYAADFGCDTSLAATACNISSVISFITIHSVATAVMQGTTSLLVGKFLAIGSLIFTGVMALRYLHPIEEEGEKQVKHPFHLTRIPMPTFAQPVLHGFKSHLIRLKMPSLATISPPMTAVTPPAAAPAPSGIATTAVASSTATAGATKATPASPAASLAPTAAAAPSVQNNVKPIVRKGTNGEREQSISIEARGGGSYSTNTRPRRSTFTVKPAPHRRITPPLRHSSQRLRTGSMAPNVGTLRTSRAYSM